MTVNDDTQAPAYQGPYVIVMQRFSRLSEPMEYRRVGEGESWHMANALCSMLNARSENFGYCYVVMHPHLALHMGVRRGGPSDMSMDL